MATIGVRAFNFDIEETSARLREFIDDEKYFVFIAQDSKQNILGFISLYESYALYAEGAFGTIPELYVRPEHRSKKLGGLLLSEARLFGSSRGWKRLEVTTPPLPQFDKTLTFYEQQGFEITGGRKPVGFHRALSGPCPTTTGKFNALPRCVCAEQPVSGVGDVR
jgi:GNAT superfamily N-acetyltransferase